MKYSRTPVFITGWIDELKKNGAEFKFILIKSSKKGERQYKFVAILETEVHELVLQRSFQTRIFKTADGAVSFWEDFFPERKSVTLPVNVEPDDAGTIYPGTPFKEIKPLSVDDLGETPRSIKSLRSKDEEDTAMDDGES